jgi:hypothetical protein
VDAIPIGVSSHTTTMIGASVTMSWVGTALTIHGNGSNGTYQTTLDGGEPTIGRPFPDNQTLVSFSGLADTNHTLNLTLLSSTQLTFFGASFEISVGKAG